MLVGSVTVSASSSTDSIVTGEKLSLQRFGSPEPSPDSVLPDDEVPAPAPPAEGPVAGIVVEQLAGFGHFGAGDGPGLPDFGFGAEADQVVTEELAEFAAEAEADGALADEHLASAPLAAFGGGEGPGLPVESAESIVISPGLRGAGAGITAPIVTVGSSGLQSFGEPEEVSCLQVAWAEVARAWADLNRAARAASAPQSGAAMGAFRKFQTAEPAFTMFLLLGLLAMLSGAASWLGSTCIRSPEKKKSMHQTYDPLGYAFAARSIEVRRATTVRAWLPWSIRV